MRLRLHFLKIHLFYGLFLAEFFRASSPVSNNCFLNPVTYLLVLGSIEYGYIAKLEECVISIY